MSEIQNCREEIINRLVMWAMEQDIEATKAKNDFYILLNDVEIMSRSTEIAEIHQDRNEMLLQKFLIAKKVGGRTERTLKYYNASIRFILNRIQKTMDDIKPDDIRLYMALRENRDKVTRTTISNEIRCFSSFCTWLTEEEYLEKNPMWRIDNPKQEKTKKEAFTEMEIEKLREAAEGERERAIIEILLSTGCRVGELVQIMLEEIDLENNRILVHGKGQKDRYVYLNARARLALLNYVKKRKDENPFLFPKMKSVVDPSLKKRKGNKKAWWKNPKNIVEGHSDTGTIEQITRKIGKKAGIKKANPHKFRRTCATILLRRGMPVEQVSQMLGHEQISTTQIYLDLSEMDLALAHRRYAV